MGRQVGSRKIAYRTLRWEDRWEVDILLTKGQDGKTGGKKEDNISKVKVRR
jgi:hypothetical protein